MPFLYDHRRRVPPQFHSARNGDRQKTLGSCGFCSLRSRIPETIDGIAEYARSQGGGQVSLSYSSPSSRAGFPAR